MEVLAGRSRITSVSIALGFVCVGFWQFVLRVQPAGVFPAVRDEMRPARSNTRM